MSKLALSFACADYHRTSALTDRSVKANGIFHLRASRWRYPKP